MAIKDGEFTYIKATGPIIEFDDEDDEDDEDAGTHGAKRSAAGEKDAKKEVRAQTAPPRSPPRRRPSTPRQAARSRVQPPSLPEDCQVNQTRSKRQAA